MSDDLTKRDPSRPYPVKGLRGSVTEVLYGKGSKSERTAVVIDSDAGRLLLRRKEGPAFGDRHLRKWLDSQVECDGFIVGTTLSAERLDLIESADD